MAVEATRAEGFAVGAEAVQARASPSGYAAERRFRLYGIAAILFGLDVPRASCSAASSSKGYTAFVQSSFKLQVVLDPDVIDPQRAARSERAA